MIIYGLLVLVQSIGYSVYQILTVNMMAYQDIRGILNDLKLINYAYFGLGVFMLAMIILMIHYLYQIGEENEIVTIWVGLEIVLIGIGISILMLIIFMPEFIKIYEKIYLSGPSIKLLNELLRIVGYLLIGFVISLIGYMICGVGLRKLGQMYSVSNLKSGGLMLILSFIPFLGPFGLIVAGMGLREIE